jgi:hypothetical protein
MTKTRDKLIKILNQVQDCGEKWSVEGNGCNHVDSVRNAQVVDFLIENGVGFVTEKNVGCKTERLTWSHESIETAGCTISYSRCPVCGGSVDGFVNYRHCPCCGNKVGK